MKPTGLTCLLGAAAFSLAITGAAFAQSVKVGAIYPFSGVAASIGVYAKAAIEVAVDIVNNDPDACGYSTGYCADPENPCRGGGERQMLAIERALMSNPKLLMLDEPSLGLGPSVIDVLYETLVRLHREGLTILLAEQAIEMALEVADYAYVLQVGRSVLSGPARQIAQDPEVQRIYLGVGAAAG